jgi:hypothetical protein
MALGNVRKPERKEDDVIVLIWLPAEEIVKVPSQSLGKS